jgi:uncharacterized protein
VRPPAPSTRRWLGGALVVLLAVLGGVACVPTGERPELVDEHLDDGAGPSGEVQCPDPVGPFAAFGTSVITVVQPDGPINRCVLVADTFELRARGLMEVTDLGGYHGMIFSFVEDTTSGFWMGNTVMPLSIAFIDATGQVVSTADMEPCPDSVDCPSYEPGAPYRWALEVHQGGLGEFGLVPGGSLDPLSLPGGIE